MRSASSVIAATPSRLLHWARRREQAGDLIGSGVCVREALMRQLRQMARDAHCLPKSLEVRNSPARLASILHKAGVLDDSDYPYVQQAIAVGNAAAHLMPVDRAALRDAICLLHFMINEPSLLPSAWAVGGEA
jgi:hypothetical protein